MVRSEGFRAARRSDRRLPPKGSRVYLEGRKRTESWDDKQTGATHYRDLVYINRIEFSVIPRPTETETGTTSPVTTTVLRGNHDQRRRYSRAVLSSACARGRQKRPPLFTYVAFRTEQEQFREEEHPMSTTTVRPLINGTSQSFWRSWKFHFRQTRCYGGSPTPRTTRNVVRSCPMQISALIAGPNAALHMVVPSAT